MPSTTRTKRAATRDQSADATPDLPTVNVPTVNLVVLRGVASAPAEHRTLQSGRALATLSVRVPAPPHPEASKSGATKDGRAQATSVPVAVWDPPAWIDGIDVDDPLVVVGRLHRRFYRTGGGTGARVEVVASLIARGSDRRRLDAAERRALAALEGLE
jgi:single-strand DNA-binding protein